MVWYIKLPTVFLTFIMRVFKIRYEKCNLVEVLDIEIQQSLQRVQGMH
jgi:hypothetical protein